MKSYKEESLDVGAINDRLIAKIAESVTITPEALQSLASKRAEAIIQNLTTKHNVATERLRTNEASSSDAIRDEWVGYCNFS